MGGYEGLVFYVGQRGVIFVDLGFWGGWELWRVHDVVADFNLKYGVVMVVAVPKRGGYGGELRGELRGE